MKNLLHPESNEIFGLKKKAWLSILFLIILCAILEIPIILANEYQKKLDALSDSLSVRKVYAASFEEPQTQEEQIRAYIVEVFGANDAKKAFQLLKCENGRLNPNAVNTTGNTPAGSRDIGVFQVNEFWQKTQGKFLFNWKINVEIAHQLYRENGNTFKLWSCGRNLSI